MVGLICSSIVSGLIVSRTGRYKWLLVGAHRHHGRGDRPDDPADARTRRSRSSGSGCSSPASASGRRSRSSRSSSRTPCRSDSSASRPRNLTFFRQIGGSVAPGHRRHDLRLDLPREDRAAAHGAAGVPPQVVAGFGQATGERRARLQQADRRRATSGRRSWPRSRPRSASAVEPFIGNIVAGIHQAFSLARRPDVLDRCRQRRSWPSWPRSTMKELPLRQARLPGQPSPANGTPTERPLASPAAAAD